MFTKQHAVLLKKPDEAGDSQEQKAQLPQR